MKKLVKWTFCFKDKQLEELKELSKKSSVPQAVFVREALDYILKKYRYFLTMQEFNSEEARYIFSKNRGVDFEEAKDLPSILNRWGSLLKPEKTKIRKGKDSFEGRNCP